MTDYFTAKKIDDLANDLTDEEFDELFDAVTYDGTDRDFYLVDWADRFGYTCDQLRMWWGLYGCEDEPYEPYGDGDPCDLHWRAGL